MLLSGTVSKIFLCSAHDTENGGILESTSQSPFKSIMENLDILCCGGATVMSQGMSIFYASLHSSFSYRLCS